MACRYILVLLCAFCAACTPVGESGETISEQAAFEAPLPVDSNAPSSENTVCSAGQAEPASYRLGPRDVLMIGVYGEADLSGHYTIGNTGAISMPLVGEILLSGCSLRQAERLLKQKYMEGYLIDPSISIEVSSFRPFYIIGEVRAPGSYGYTTDMSVLKAVALAGGFTYRANRKNVKILKHGQGSEYEYRPVESEINPGDVVFVRERLF